MRPAVRAALLAFLVLGLGWSSADAGIPPRGEAAREVRLLKPPHEKLRIRWSANVHEEGGEFILSRRGFRGPVSVVARLRPRSDGRYVVVEPGAAGSWTYELKYRTRHGHERVLATVRVNVDRLASGLPTLTGGVNGPPAALRPAALLPVPGAWTAASASREEIAHGGPGRWPPTPPP